MFCKPFDDKNPKRYSEIKINEEILRVFVIPRPVKKKDNCYVMAVGEENTVIGDITVIRSSALGLTADEAFNNLEYVLRQAIQTKQSINCDEGIVQIKQN